MKLKCLHFGLAVGFIGVLLYGAQPQSADAAEPSRLTDSQLDAVTAGTLVLSVEATAIAIGQDTYTSTDSLTRVYSRGVVDMGWCEGSALAVASGAETFTYADVRIGAWADGDIVIMRGDSTTLMGTNLAYETADLFVVSVNSPGLAKR